ncbi:MAG: hypothetical protein ACYS9T_07345 [Planctomycetota bacterium]
MEGKVVADWGRAEVAALAGDISHVTVLTGGDEIYIAAELRGVYAFDGVVGAVEPFTVGALDGQQRMGGEVRCRGVET